MSNNNFEHGKLGEFICATHLLKMGEKTEIVNLSTIDLIVHRDSRLIRIQVKSSRYKLKDNMSKFRGYQFSTVHGGIKRPLTEKECDVLGFVATDLERVIFKPAKNFNQITKRFAKKHFLQNDVEQASWNETMESIL
tara:strand:- start:20874 stop:21284 length:411 start_codon:yes stop_codon:yes gene_type:complete